MPKANFRIVKEADTAKLAERREKAVEKISSFPIRDLTLDELDFVLCARHPSLDLLRGLPTEENTSRLEAIAKRLFEERRENLSRPI